MKWFPKFPPDPEDLGDVISSLKVFKIELLLGQMRLLWKMTRVNISYQKLLCEILPPSSLARQGCILSVGCL